MRCYLVYESSSDGLDVLNSHLKFRQREIEQAKSGTGKKDEEKKEVTKKWVEPPEKQVHLWPGHDYTNFIVADFAELHLPYKGIPVTLAQTGPRRKNT